MDKIKVAIFENNEEFSKELSDGIAKEENYEVVAQTSDGIKAIELLSQSMPDIAIVDLVLSGLDGFGVLDYIKKECGNCKAIVLSNIGDDKIISSAIERGALFYILKPTDCKNVLSRIKDISSGMATKKPVRLDEKISNIFTTIGIPPHIKGFAFLREGIKLTVNDPSIINRVTKELYPRIAATYGTSASKVERAIRHAIEVAWNRGRTDAISSIFGARVYIGTERPTNSEFIALVADKLILETLE